MDDLYVDIRDFLTAHPGWHTVQEIATALHTAEAAVALSLACGPASSSGAGSDPARRSTRVPAPQASQEVIGRFLFRDDGETAKGEPLPRRSFAEN